MAKASTGGVMLWRSDAQLVVAQALWYGGLDSTVNLANIYALLWCMSKLRSLLANGKILVLGKPHLVISFCTCSA